MLQLLPTLAVYSKQELTLFDSSALFGSGNMKQFHARHIARYGAELMVRVYRASMEQLLENACAWQRLQLCNTFREVVNEAIDAHFAELDLADSALRLSLADNAKQWLAFVHCTSQANKTCSHQVYAAFLATYGDELLAQTYLKVFEQILQQRTSTESLDLLSTIEQVLDQALETNPYHAAA